MAIRFHLDESVPVAVDRPLVQRGIDVTTPADAGLSGTDDDAQLAFLLAERRVLVTHDVDYLRIHGSGVSHAGIVYCHQSRYSIGELLHLLHLVHLCYTEAEIRGRVEFI